MSRRTVLGGAAAMALLAGCEEPEPEPTPDPEPGPTIDPQEFDHGTPLAFAPASLPEDADAFATGVRSGSMKTSSALICTHVGVQTEVLLRVWRESPNAGEVILVHEERVAPQDGGYVKLTVDGLAPATRYRYGFFVEESGVPVRRSVLGGFRTAFPEGWAAPFTIGASTCTNWRNMPYRTLELTAEEELDAFVHLGDMSYNDGSYYLQDYREKWQRTFKDPGYRAIFAAAGLYATWDDHEFDNNIDPEAMAAISPARLKAAKDAYFESLPLERGENDRLWRSYKWGSTAEIFILDCRSERQPSTRLSEKPVYIGEEQMSWLKEALQASTAHFKILLNSVPMTNFPGNLWGGKDDRWQGYWVQRQELFDHIVAKKISNVWFLSGDFHLGFAVRLDMEGPGRNMWEVAVGPGGNAGNPLTVLLEGASEANRELAFPKAQFAFACGANSATTLTFDPRKNAVRVRYLDPQTREVRFDSWLRQGD